MFPGIWGSSDQKKKEEILIPPDQLLYDDYKDFEKKYPGWIPIIIHPIDVKLKKLKFLTRPPLPFALFADIVREHCQWGGNPPIAPLGGSLPNGDKKGGVPPRSSQSVVKGKFVSPLFFSAKGIFLPPEQEMGKIYAQYKKDDGFLHIVVRGEPGPLETPPQVEGSKPEVAKEGEAPQIEGKSDKPLEKSGSKPDMTKSGSKPDLAKSGSKPDMTKSESKSDMTKSGSKSDIKSQCGDDLP